jgi:hypothetical protein
MKGTGTWFDLCLPQTLDHRWNMLPGFRFALNAIHTLSPRVPRNALLRRPASQHRFSRDKTAAELLGTHNDLAHYLDVKQAVETEPVILPDVLVQ